MTQRRPHDDGDEPRRVVLLGASNVARGIAAAVSVASATIPGPLEFFVACGHGRSFGLKSCLLGRTLPGIVPCGLWHALDREPVVPARAVVTDIGNDVLYGVPVPRIVAWFEQCVDRLQRVNAQITVTRLPVDCLERLGPGRYYALRMALYPRCRLTRARAIHAARALDDNLHAVIQARRLREIRPPPDWYGLDPIHIRRRCQWTAWCTLLGRDPDRVPRMNVVRSGTRAVYLKTIVPEHRWIFGYHQQRCAPQGRLADGSTVALF